LAERTIPASLLENVGYSASLIRFWRVASHREGLEVLAEATTRSGEADYLTFEWSLIRDGNHAEFQLRQDWAIQIATFPEQDPRGWKYTPTWKQIEHVFGPPHDRHRACLCNWLHGKPYPATVSGGGGSGDAGGRARRIIADLDSARSSAPAGLSEYELERYMSVALGSDR